MEFDDDEKFMTHECGIFGAVAPNDWNEYELPQMICIALESLQHRYLVHKLDKFYFYMDAL